MRYSVVWRPSAEADLAELWLNAGDRDVVRKAADSIDAELRRAPYAVGESRDGVSRIVIAPPLAVLYDVIEDDKLVSVWSVLLWKRRGG